MGNDVSTPLASRYLFSLRFAAKELQKQSRKCDQQQNQEKSKIKEAIKKGNTEVARIHAENAIRQKNLSLNYLKMSARVDAVASKVQGAIITKNVTTSMAGVVKTMDEAIKSMNLEKMSNVLDRFERQFDEIGVRTNVIENTMAQATTTLVPENDVTGLMKQLADEAGLELNVELPRAVATEESEQDKEILESLARLQDNKD